VVIVGAGEEVVDLFRRQVSACGVQEFISFGRGAQLTFVSFDPDSDGLARNPAGLGAVPGDGIMALLGCCAELIPRFAVPRFIEVLEDVPKFATGKIQKEPLHQVCVTDRCWDRNSLGNSIVRRV